MRLVSRLKVRIEKGVLRSVKTKLFHCMKSHVVEARTVLPTVKTIHLVAKLVVSDLRVLVLGFALGLLPKMRRVNINSQIAQTP